MKKALYLGFCLVLAMGVGCAITNYELITDNGQLNNGQGHGVVNTNGKAKIIPSAQTATLWEDGNDNLWSMVDQKANGDRTITTYNHFSTEGEPTFFDDLYCNPDWQGCAITTASDPEIGDDDIFDYNFNLSCNGIRSLSLLLSTGRYYGECGRAKVGVLDRVALMASGELRNFNGSEALYYGLNRNNLSITLNNNAGVASALRMTGDIPLYVNLEGRTPKFTMDMSNPLLSNMGRGLADFQRSFGTGKTTATVTYNGVSINWDFSADHTTVNSFVRQKF